VAGLRRIAAHRPGSPTRADCRDARHGDKRKPLDLPRLRSEVLIGGYAQLSFAFNYYGPTGSQRDEVTVLRKRVSEPRY
jgi:nitrate reductase / nitrite oxidoreductase, alpha subunit